MSSYLTSDSSNGSSQNGSRSASISGGTRHDQSKPRHNVKFNVGVEEDNDDTSSSPRRYSIPELRLPEADITESPMPGTDGFDWNRRKDEAALVARNKAHRHANRVKKHNSAPTSRRTSIDEGSTVVGSPSGSSPYTSPPQRPFTSIRLDDIPLEKLTTKRTFDLPGDSTSEDDDDDDEGSETRLKPLKGQETQHFSEARRLLRTFTSHAGGFMRAPKDQAQSGSATPLIDQHSHEFDYVPRPNAYQKSVLAQLLTAQKASSYIHEDASHDQLNYIANQLESFTGKDDPRKKNPDFFQTRMGMPRSPGSLSGAQTPLGGSEGSSGTMTPRQKRPKWYKSQQEQWNSIDSAGSLGKLVESSFHAAAVGAAPEASVQKRPEMKRNTSSGRLLAYEMLKHPLTHIRNANSSGNLHRQANIQMGGIAERLASQDYIIEVCKALMAYGAPTHRLEEFLSMAARKLCIQASFQYLPSCMIMSFDDPDTHTTELKLIKEPTNVDLGKLKEVQQVYKDVMHNQYSLHEAMDDIREIRNRRKKYGTPTLITMYGVAAAAVGPFAFSARPIDLPISFILGCTLGALQLGLASRSSQFSHIFEVFGTFITSFAARGFGSILTSSGEPLFCFSALAQSSIALILPGWIILSAALELQSRNIIAGSIRMVYAIIYTLFLGFGILIGTTIMGLMYADATNDITCYIPEYWDASSNSWRLIYTKFIWVPVFTVCLAIINQAKWKQIPWMVIISFCGYQVNYWSALRFSQNIQVANALGAFVIGVLANGYSRFRHGVAAAAMLPAIFVMVPSGLAASGSLVAGLTSANQITHNVTGISIVNNGTQGFYDAQNTTTTTSVYGGTIFNVGYGMVQVAIGISVGLFLSALVIYPFGKKRSGIFSF